MIRNLGRTIIEMWLYANELLLDPDQGAERFFGEDALAQAREQDGLMKLWERYESKREGGKLLADPEFERGDVVRPSVEALAQRVVELRKAAGLGDGALADLQYQYAYRRDSAQDVHVTLDHLFRYMDFEEGFAMLLKRPGDEDNTAFRGPKSLLEDARMLADALGLYLSVTKQDEQLAKFRSLVASSLDE